jgi:amino acid permease
LNGDDKPQKSLTAFEAGLALLSAIVGGGIVGIPYAMFHTGIPLGLALNFGVALAGWYTGNLYLRVKDLSPTYVESMYELGFVTMGACSIYFFSFIILISGVGCIMIYFIVFSNISASIAVQIQDEGTDNIFTDRTIYVLFLALIMTPLCLKKMLAEMKIVSILLFSAIAIFIGLFIVQLLTLGSIENHDETYG